MAQAKRQRVESKEPVTGGASLAVASRIADDVEALVLSASNVSTAVVDAVLGRLNAAHGAVADASKQNVELAEVTLESLKGRVAAEVRCAELRRHLAERDASLHSMEAQLQECVDGALARVTSQVAATATASLGTVMAELDAERRMNWSLAKQMQLWLQQSHAAERERAAQLLRVEAQCAGKDVQLAHLQSSCNWSNTAILRHREEVRALISITRHIAERSRHVLETQAEVQRAKNHVRLLEQHLTLSGVAEAILRSDEAAAAAITLRGPGPRNDAATGGRPLDPSWKQAAPEYFALRVLEAKDVTLSELVESWLEQEGRICAAERRLQEVQADAQQLRKDAMAVQCRYLEERQRREAVECRLADLVRQRIQPSSNTELLMELSQLRTSYSVSLDRAAQQSVTLELVREQLTEVTAELDALKEHVARSNQTVTADTVAQSLAELRVHYETELARLRRDYEGSETLRLLADVERRKQEQVAEEAIQALRIARGNNSTLLESLKSATEQRHGAAVARPSREDGQASAAKLAAAQLEALTKLSASRSASQPARYAHPISDREQAAAGAQLLEELQNVMSAFVAQLREGGAAARWDTHGGSGSRDATAAVALSSGRPLGVREVEYQESLHAMRRVLVHALGFVASQLETSDAFRSQLVDLSLSDSAYATLMFQQLQDAVAERDAARAEVAKCHQLIDRHGLRAAESVLMHGGTAPPSTGGAVDTAATREQVVQLQEEVAMLRAVKSRLGEEVVAWEARHAESDDEAVVLHKALAVLQRHNDRLAAQLQTCDQRISTMLADLHVTHARLQGITERMAAAAPAVTGHEEEAPRGVGERDGEVVSQPVGPAGATEWHAPLAAMLAGMETVREQLSDIKRRVLSVDAGASGLDAAPDSCVRPRHADEYPGAMEDVVEEGADAATDPVGTLETDIQRHGLHAVVAAVQRLLGETQLLRPFIPEPPQTPPTAASEPRELPEDMAPSATAPADATRDDDGDACDPPQATRYDVGTMTDPSIDSSVPPASPPSETAAAEAEAALEALQRAHGAAEEQLRQEHEAERLRHAEEVRALSQEMEALRLEAEAKAKQLDAACHTQEELKSRNQSLQENLAKLLRMNKELLQTRQGPSAPAPS